MLLAVKSPALSKQPKIGGSGGNPIAYVLTALAALIVGLAGGLVISKLVKFNFLKR